MAARLDDVVDEAWRMYDYYRGFWFTGSRRLAIERVATYAYREGLKDQPADALKEQGPKASPVRVVVEQNKSLFTSVIGAAVGVTGSAAVTQSAGGWVATGVAWGGVVLAVLLAGVRSWAARS